MSKRKKAAATPATDANASISIPQNTVPGAPTAVHEVEMLKKLLEGEKQKVGLQQEMLEILKLDKAFLQEQLTKKEDLIQELMNKMPAASDTGVKRKHGGDRKAPLKKAKQLKRNINDDEEEDSSSILSDSSEDSSVDSHQVRKSKSPASSSKSPASSSSSRLQVKHSNTDDLIGRSRARNTRSIIARYKMAIDAFNRGGSMKAAFESISADRNTVCRTAPVAELSLAAPDIFKNVGAWDGRKEKLSSFVDRCRAAMTPEVKEKITKMKQDGDLLPIATHV